MTLMTQDEDSKNPWYANVLFKIGVPSAIALYVVVAMTNAIFTELPKINKAISDQNTAISALVKTLDAENQQQRNNNRLIINLLLASCINEANYDKLSIQRCLDDGN